MTWLARFAVKCAILAAVLAVLAVTHLVTLDYSGGAYGISAGTSASYCSADLVRWRPSVTCEHAH